MGFLKVCGSGRLWLHVRDDRGATAVEYGLMAALIAAVITVAVGFIGISVANLFVIPGL